MKTNRAWVAILLFLAVACFSSPFWVGSKVPSAHAITQGNTPNSMNHDPIDIFLSQAGLLEESPIGTEVGQFTTQDPDTWDTHTYSLVGGVGDTDNGSFQIDGATLKTAAVLDRGTYDIRVQTEDLASATFQKTFQITAGAKEGTIQVSKTGTGSGNVTSDPAGIDCGSDCEADFPTGTEVTLTATPVSGSSFSGWTDNGCSGTAPCTVTVNDDMTISVNFDQDQTGDSNTLTMEMAGDGSGNVTSDPAGIDCGSDCEADFSTGTEVTLTAIPGEGSVFDGWSSPDCTDKNRECVIKLVKDYLIKAKFALDGDGDGVSNLEENNGPNNGDGNDDLIQDSIQNHVASLQNRADTYWTLIVDSDLGLKDVQSYDNPSPGDPPSGVTLPQGFLGFTITGVPDSDLDVQALLLDHQTEASDLYDTFMKYGPTPDRAEWHWYEFDYDGTTGNQLVTHNGRLAKNLYFKDGQRGDDDLTVNGEITGDGAPAETDPTAAWFGGGGSGGFGGCEGLNAAAKRHPAKVSGFDPTILILALVAFLVKAFIRSRKK